MKNTLSELSKQANELYDDFLEDFKQYANSSNTITEKEQEEIMEQIYLNDYMDTEEYDPADCMYYGPTGHWDEKAYSDYMYATDEDGNWLHPYDLDI